MARRNYCLSLLLLICLNTGCQTAALPPTSATVLVTVEDAGIRPSLQRGFHRDSYGLSQRTRYTLRQLEQDYGLRQIDGWPIRVLGVYCAVMVVEGNNGRQTVLDRLQQDNRVSLAQPLQEFDVQAATYNDPYFSVQYRNQTRVIAALHQRLTGRGVSIALIDTGIDRQHPDLRDGLIESRNFVDQDPSFDSDIHGTALAGVIVSHPNNRIGIVGLAPDVRLLALKACWQSQPKQIAARCNSFTLAKALAFAIEQHADIVNLSLTGPPDPLLSQLVQRAIAAGAIVVAARSDDASFPAREPGVVAIGLEPGGIAQSELLNGSDILSTSPGGGYDFFHGVSLLAAQVSALTALLKQQTPAQPVTPHWQHDLQQLIQRDLAVAAHD